MRTDLAFAGLLASGVTALPQAIDQHYRVQVREEPTPVLQLAGSYQQHSTPVTGPTPTATQGDPDDDDDDDGDDDDDEEDDEPDACDMKFETQEEGETSWNDSGAGDFLADYLDENGLEHWANSILTDTVASGLNGKTFNCENVESVGSCGLPQDRPCESYDPHEAYFIQQSIGNYAQLFSTIYHSLESDQLEDLAGKAGTIQDEFGEAEEDGMFPFLIGVFVLGAATAGPTWQAGAAFTAVVGALNIAAGLADEPESVEDGLEQLIRDSYNGLGSAIEDTFEAVMSGNFDSLDVDDPTDFILSAFEDGQMMVVDTTNDRISDYLDFVEKLVNHKLIIKCLEANDWYLYIFQDMGDEGECEESTNGAGYILSTPEDGDTCVAIGYKEEQVGNPRNPLTRTHLEFLEGDKLDAAEGYDMDIQEVIQNILDCDGGEFDYEDAISNGFEGTYPSCLFSLPIEKFS